MKHFCQTQCLFIRQPNTTFFHYSSGTSCLAREWSLKWCDGLQSNVFSTVHDCRIERVTVFRVSQLSEFTGRLMSLQQQLFIVTFERELDLMQQVSTPGKTNLYNGAIGQSIWCCWPMRIDKYKVIATRANVSGLQIGCVQFMMRTSNLEKEYV